MQEYVSSLRLDSNHYTLLYSTLLYSTLLYSTLLYYPPTLLGRFRLPFPPPNTLKLRGVGGGLGHGRHRKGV